MIHYTCDCCKCKIDTENELRFVVKMEVYAALDNTETTNDSEYDYLSELEVLLDQTPFEEELLLLKEEIYQQIRYDLCASCRKKVLRNPLGFRSSPSYDYSKN